MKKWNIGLLTLALGFSLNSYAQDKVGVTIYHYGDDFMQLMKDELASASHQKDIKLLFNDAQNSQFVQNNQVTTLLENKAKVLAVNLVYPNAWSTTIGNAKERNIPVIFFNRDPGNKAIASYDKAYYVGSDPAEAGILQARMIAKQWKANPQFDLNRDGKIQYALLKGEDFHPDAEIRTKSVISELEKQGLKIDQLALEPANWQMQMAKEKVLAWLASDENQIEVIIANNDAMAIGAAEAVATHGKRLPIYGVDAVPEALNFIKLGMLAGTVKNDWINQSKAIIDFAANLAKGKPAASGTNWQLKGRVLRIPYITIEKENLN